MACNPSPLEEAEAGVLTLSVRVRASLINMNSTTLFLLYEKIVVRELFLLIIELPSDPAIPFTEYDLSIPKFSAPLVKLWK